VIEYASLYVHHLFHIHGARKRKRSCDDPEGQDDIAETDEKARWKWNHAELSRRSARAFRTQL
jgi:hypothetical protein